MGWDWRRTGLVREAGEVWRRASALPPCWVGHTLDGQHAGQLGGPQGAAVEACLLGSGRRAWGSGSGEWQWCWTRTSGEGPCCRDTWSACTRLLCPQDCCRDPCVPLAERALGLTAVQTTVLRMHFPCAHLELPAVPDPPQVQAQDCSAEGGKAASSLQPSSGWRGWPCSARSWGRPGSSTRGTLRLSRGCSGVFHLSSSLAVG